MDVFGYSFSLRMLNLDSRIELVQLKYSKGDITCIDDILPILPKTTLAKYIGIDFKRFDRLLIKAEKVMLMDLLSMGKTFGWTVEQTLAIWNTQYEVQKSKKKINGVKSKS